MIRVGRTDGRMDGGRGSVGRAAESPASKRTRRRIYGPAGEQASRLAGGRASGKADGGADGRAGWRVLEGERAAGVLANCRAGRM